MAKIGLSKGFRRLQEGPGQILVIADISYDDKYGKAQVTFEDERGGSQVETYTMGAPGKKQTRGNKVAADICAAMAKHALHDWEAEEIDPEELVGLTVMADVTRDKTTDDSGETRYYTHVRNFKEAPAEEDEDAEGLFS